jgi:hypothetical protein
LILNGIDKLVGIEVGDIFEMAKLCVLMSLNYWISCKLQL